MQNKSVEPIAARWAAPAHLVVKFNIMKSKAALVIIVISISIAALLYWSYLVSRSEVELQLKTNKRTSNMKMILHKSELLFIDFAGEIKPCWQFYYTPDDRYDDLYVFVSLTGEIIADTSSIIKRMPVKKNSNAK